MAIKTDLSFRINDEKTITIQEGLVVIRHIEHRVGLDVRIYCDQYDDGGTVPLNKRSEPISYVVSESSVLFDTFFSESALKADGMSFRKAAYLYLMGLSEYEDGEKV